jgi:hypothetical protein
MHLTKPLTTSLFALTIHVPADSSTIQGGINGAVNGDTVLVAPGTYYEHNIDFLGKAITVTGTDPEDSTVVMATVVNAYPLGRVFLFQSSEDSASTLAGLTITRGLTTDDGGGIFCNSSSPKILNNIILDNQADRGGGIYCYESSPQITGNKIKDNSAREHGGGLMIESSSPMITGNVIIGNRAETAGGGLRFWESSSSITGILIASNLFIGNWAGTHGGGISTYSSNELDFIDISNNTITENSVDYADGGGGLTCSGYAPYLTNCILWDNEPKQIDEAGYAPAVAYCNVEDGYRGEGNINVDPLFVDPLNNDFHLQQDPCQPGIENPCVDAGDPDSPMIWGTTRTDGNQDWAIIDLGYHYPYEGTGNIPSYATFVWDPVNPVSEETILFDASRSYDLDGSIVSYEWDWDSDGVYDESHIIPTTYHSWSVPDTYLVILRVVDTDSDTVTNLESIIIYPYVKGVAVEEWTSGFIVEDYKDEANAIVLDGEDNVYVTGDSWNSYSGNNYSDCVTIKYDKHGNILWSDQYRVGDYTEGIDLAADDSGRVYVSGRTKNVGTGNFDLITIKYDPDGNREWDVQESSDGGVADAIALDGGGNPHIVGKHTQGDPIGNVYMVTIKYDSDGDQQWVESVLLGEGSGDAGQDIIVDADGNVYVTGRGPWGESDHSDYLTIKYDAAGNLLWSSVYGDTVGSVYDDKAKAIAFDGSGNVYVTGSSSDISTDRDWVTIKYDSDGEELWVARYTGPIYGEDDASALAVDQYGNVYVTGWSRGVVTAWDYVTIKYDTDGNELWVRRYNGPANTVDYAQDLALDTRGNVYVTGGSLGDGTDYFDYATIKYSTDGQELWVARHDGPRNTEGSYSHDYSNAIAVGRTGDIYITGKEAYDAPYREEIATIKYRQLYIKRDEITPESAGYVDYP